MLSFIIWFIVLAASVVAVAGAAHIAEESAMGKRYCAIRSYVAIGCGAAVALAGISLLWRSHAVARLDSRGVSKMADARGQTLQSIMDIATTLGDAIPSLLIAMVLALVIFRLRRRSTLVLLIPLAVIAELAIQIGMTKIFHDVTLTQVAPDIVTGKSGTIPSGSVARLLSIFLIAGRLWRPRGDFCPSALVTVGCGLVMLQITTRLYLGRHLIADIAAGILLGVLLERSAALLLELVDRRDSARATGLPPKTA